MRRHARVGTKENLHAGLVSLGECSLNLWPDHCRFRTNQCREKALFLGTIENPRTGRDGRNVIGAALLHQFDGLVIHEGAVLDGIDTGANRALHALSAVRMRGHLETIITSSLHDAADLFLGELRV